MLRSDNKPSGRLDCVNHHLSSTFATASPEDAAKAAASAIADGIVPASIGEAISHAASQLVLMDAGRFSQWEDRLKPAGSVHGDSVGVYASEEVPFHGTPGGRQYNDILLPIIGTDGEKCFRYANHPVN